MLDQTERMQTTEAMSLSVAPAPAAQRMAWPAAAAVIIGASAGLWALITLAVSRLDLF